MLDLKLFLGVKADTNFQQQLSHANPYLLSLFIGKEEYLQEISHDECSYLGKMLPSSKLTIDQLEQIQQHLISLLKMVAPTYSSATSPPLLLTLS